MAWIIKTKDGYHPAEYTEAEDTIMRDSAKQFDTNKEAHDFKSDNQIKGSIIPY